jgi:coronin-1B/1C/6
LCLISSKITWWLILFAKVHENEVARAYKTVNDSYIEPISFIVPRRAEVFQEDIYPPTFGIKAAMSAGEWFDGKTAIPPLVSLKGRYDGGDADELPAEVKPKDVTPVAIKSPTKTEAPKAAPAPAPEKPVERAPPPTVKDSKQSIETMASKYTDKFEESEEDDDASSFEEVAKPIERPARTQEPVKPTPAPAPAAAAAPVARSIPKQDPAPPAAAPIAISKSISPKEPSPPAETASPSTAAKPSALAEGLKGHLTDIKSSQGAALSEIADLKSQVSDLTDLVKQLSSRLDGLVGGQNERIRRVELEVEGLRE